MKGRTQSMYISGRRAMMKGKGKIRHEERRKTNHARKIYMRKEEEEQRHKVRQEGKSSVLSGRRIGKAIYGI